MKDVTCYECSRRLSLLDDVVMMDELDSAVFCNKECAYNYIGVQCLDYDKHDGYEVYKDADNNLYYITEDIDERWGIRWTELNIND